MISKTKLLVSALILALTTTGVGCSREPDRVERWATTENTNVQIDWNKVNEAYKQANGPEDLEKRINEIYEGDEVISIAVKDEEDKTQVVTGFFDKNTNGAVEDNEKIFTIKREPTPEGAQVQTTGYGPYAGYHSPFFSIVSGMVVGSMISSMFAPRYVPMAYTTSPAQLNNIRTTRTAYRQANPSQFKRSQSGRTYGGTKSTGTSRPMGRSGGGRFGVTPRGPVRKLTA
jgi:hypothetical protein